MLVVVTSGTASNFFMFISRAEPSLAFSLLYIFNASLTTDTMIIINLGFQTAMAKIVTMQKKVWEPSCTEIRPSFLVSQ